MADEKEVKKAADQQRKQQEQDNRQQEKERQQATPLFNEADGDKGLDKDGQPLPRLVQAPGDMSEDELLAENEKTPSARSQFVAGPLDGVWSPEQQREQLGEPAGRREQVAAFAEYVERPDIESRQSILAREMALPAQFSTENVESGSVVDGRVGVNGPGFGVEDDEAKAEAATVKDNTAYNG